MQRADNSFSDRENNQKWLSFFLLSPALYW